MNSVLIPKNFLTHRSLKVAILFICTLFILSSFAILALAQQPAPFVIKAVPKAGPPIAGRPFTYTLVVTHTGHASVENMLVFADTPAGATFAATSQDTGWFTADLDVNQSGTVAWSNQKAVAPGQVVTFELSVNVLPETASKQLVLNRYGVGLLGGSDILTTGPPVEVLVLAAPPTATPTPPPTATAAPTFAAPNSPTASATFTPQPSATPTNRVTPSPIVTPPSTQRTAAVSVTNMLAAAGLLVLVSGGVYWYVRGRGN